MRVATLLLAALCLSPAARAHEGEHDKPSNHAKKGEHEDAPASFVKRPAVGTWAKCPVSNEVFKVTARTHFSTYRGRTYAFCCDECQPDFDADPARYGQK